MVLWVPPGTWLRGGRRLLLGAVRKRPLESASFRTHGEPAVAPGARGQACKSGEIDGGEGYRKLGAQRQRAGGGRQTVRRHEGGEYPPGQGHPGDAPRYATHFRWREDHGALSAPPTRSSAPTSRTRPTTIFTKTTPATPSWIRTPTIKSRFPRTCWVNSPAYLQESMPVTLSLHEGVPVAGRTAPARDLRNRRGRPRRQRPDGLVILQAGRARKWPARDGAAAHPGAARGSSSPPMTGPTSSAQKIKAASQKKALASSAGAIPARRWLH